MIGIIKNNKENENAIFLKMRGCFFRLYINCIIKKQRIVKNNFINIRTNHEMSRIESKYNP